MSEPAIPLVALVGRPNVGKSTLFNRLVGARAALVDDQPGVTRDRLFGELRFEGKLLRVVDTGGFEPRAGDDLMASTLLQTQLAIDEADLVLLILDGAAGLLPGDEEMAALLRARGKPTLAVANKIDAPQHEERLADLYGLGLAPILPVSAEHGRGVGELCELLCARLSPPDADAAAAAAAPLPVAGDEPEEGTESRIEWPGGPIRVATIGRPNVGKSSVVNALLGEQRLVASSVPGTTRDAVDTPLSRDGQPFVLVDTAGIRRTRSVAERLESVAVMMAVRSLDRADVALVVLDAGEPPTEQDVRVAALAHERGKGLLLVANKWDLVPRGRRLTEYERLLRHWMPFARYAPVLAASALTGRGIEAILPAVIDAQRERHRRVSTAALNRFFAEVVATHPPPTVKSRRPRLYFATQPLVRPPTFVFSASNAHLVPEAYTRYLGNALRERFGFGGTAIWVKIRPRGKARAGRETSRKRR